MRLQLLALGQLGSQVQPGRTITASADLIGDVNSSLSGDTVVESLVGPEVVEVVGDGGGVMDVDEVAGLAVDDLEWDTSGTGGNGGLAVVERLGDLDFETFTERELKDDLGVGEEGVEHCR